MQVYIDESGNLGRQGRYFVVNALVIPDSSANKGKRLKNIVKHFLAESSMDEIKGHDLTVPERQQILGKLCKCEDHQFVYICLDKKNLANRRLLVDKNLLFNYLCKLVFQRILNQYNNPRLDVFVDERNVRHDSRHLLKDYLTIELEIGTDKINLDYYNSSTIPLIQIADVIAGVVHNKYTREQNHEYSLVKYKKSLIFPLDVFGR